MRPGRFHPGNFPRLSFGGLNVESFNEAGAFPPRKSPKYERESYSTNSSFNEAGAFPPRKCEAGKLECQRIAELQ